MKIKNYLNNNKIIMSMRNAKINIKISNTKKKNNKNIKKIIISKDNGRNFNLKSNKKRKKINKIKFKPLIILISNYNKMGK